MAHFCALPEMGDPKAETAELLEFHGLRPSSRKAASKPIASPAQEKPKKLIAAADRVDENATCTYAPSVEAMKSEIMWKMATLEASLVTEIQESRSREEKLRSKLARSRVATRDLQAKLTKYDHAQRQLHAQVIEAPEASAPSQPIAMAAPWPIARRASRRPPALSCCGALRQLARNQVIRSVQDLAPEFSVDLEVHSYGGYIPWPKVLEWLEDHPEMVNTLGLNLQALRTI